MSDTVLEVKNLVTTFRINKKEYPVIRDISFEIHENETLCGIQNKKRKIIISR